MLNHVVQARNVRYSAMHNKHSWVQLVFIIELAIITMIGASSLEYGNRILNYSAPSLIGKTPTKTP